MENTLRQSLKVLGIEDYYERILNSNSHGELFHCYQYISLAENWKDDPIWFRVWFEYTVRWAENNWERPESVFQHINKLLIDYLEEEPLTSH